MSKRKYSLLSWAYGLLAGAGGGMEDGDIHHHGFCTELQTGVL